jgi:hypothetical protein
MVEKFSAVVNRIITNFFTSRIQVISAKKVLKCVCGYCADEAMRLLSTIDAVRFGVVARRGAGIVSCKRDN